MTPSPANPGALNWILILFVGVVWGTAFMTVRLSLEGFGPWTVAALRTSIAALALVAGSMAMGQGLRMVGSLRGWAYCIAIGMAGTAMPFLLLAWGQQHVPSAFAGVAMGAVPLMILPLVYVFSPEEGIGPRRIVGIVLGFAGLAVLMGPGALAAGAGEFGTLGRLACIGATGCYAVGSVLTRRCPPIPPLTMAAATMLVAALVLAPLALMFEGLPRQVAPSPLMAVIYLALAPTALAGLIRIRVIVTAGSLFMSLVSYMVPVWAVIFGVTLMGEELPGQLFFALALILSGIGLSQWRSLRAGLRRAG